MSYVMSPIETTLPDDSSYATWASLQVGSNGDPNGTPTTFIGDIYGEEDWAYNTFDVNPTGGFDTSSVPISFDVSSDGNETLNVANDDALTYQTDSLGPITSVVFEAAVQTNATAGWSSINVEFLKNGSVVEVDSLADGPQVNTVNAGSSDVADQTLTITPNVPNSDEVVVTGIMRMTSPGISSPAPQAMFCNIFVNGANATTSGSGGTGIGVGGNNSSGG